MLIRGSTNPSRRGPEVEVHLGIIPLCPTEVWRPVEEPQQLYMSSSARLREMQTHLNKSFVTGFTSGPKYFALQTRPMSIVRTRVLLLLKNRCSRMFKVVARVFSGAFLIQQCN